MNETTDATAIFAPIWRRKWLILAVAILVGAASYFYYKRQRPTFQTSTQIFLGAGAEEQAPTEKAVKGRASLLQDEIAVINTIVVEQVRRKLVAEHKGVLTKGATVHAKSPEKSEFISITVEAHKAQAAVLLANLTAQTYIKRQKEQRQRAIERAIAISRRQLRRIEASAIAQAEKPTRQKTSSSAKGTSSSGASSGSSSAGSSEAGSRSSESAASVIQEANLSSKINQLESSLQTTTAQQVKPAKRGTTKQLSPKPKKDAIFGFVLGFVLAAIAAYAFSRFDRRLRSLAAIERVTALPLLTVLPKVRRPVVSGADSARPSVHLLEPLRRLHASLQNVGADPTEVTAPRVLLVVSSDPGDGKSTLVADLALVQREAGERVVIVEANFRRPSQLRLLGLDREQGHLADAIGGRLDVDESMQRVSPSLATQLDSPGEAGHALATAVQSEVGALFVLAGERGVANPPALLAHESAAEVIRQLAMRFDSVLIDAPSPLEFSDVMPLLGIVNAIIVVARVGHSREASAQRLRQLLARPGYAPVLGVVANFVARGELKRYGFSPPRGGRAGGETKRR